MQSQEHVLRKTIRPAHAIAPADPEVDPPVDWWTEVCGQWTETDGLS
jgi:hypothetical protein